MRYTKSRFFYFVHSFVLSFLAVETERAAQGIEYAWKNPPAQGSALVHYNWGNTNYWEPVGLPGANDGATIAAGSCQIVDRVDVKMLTISDAEIFGPGPFAVNNLVAANAHFADAVALNYTNYPTGDFRFDLLETANFSGPIAVRAKFANFGNTTISNATFTCYSTMYKPASNYVRGWINQPGSTLDLYGSILFRYSDVMQQFAFFRNEIGAMVRKKGTDSTRIEWRLNSDGGISVEGGKLEFLYPESVNGPMTVEAGGVLRFDNSSENLLIGNDATFDGGGRLEFYGANAKTIVSDTTAINCDAAITNGTFEGEMLLFTRPATWKGVTWKNPVQFFLGGYGSGNVSNSLVNFGVMIDAGINSGPGVSALNVPPAYYYASNAFQGSFWYSGTNVARFGWFTNSLGATVHLRSGQPNPSLRWNFYNEGVLRFDADIKPRFPGGFVQGSSGITELTGQRIGIQAHLDLDGRLTGWGSITSHTARISGTLSPHGSNSAFGRLEIRNANNEFVAFPTNEITMDPETILEVDLGAPGTTNDYFFISGSNPTRAGIVNIRAREGFAPGTFPFFFSGAQNLRFGSVPPGFRYSFATNGNVLAIVVTKPELPPAMVRRNASAESGAELILNTLSNVSYSVHFTDDLAQPWQFWTNLVGDGQEIVLPVFTNAPSGYFQIVEE